jgi:hypothetical protein
MCAEENHRDSTPSAISAEYATERLAECLYYKMERIDPTGRGLWENLSVSEREYYRASIREILLEKTLLARAMGRSSDSPTMTE